MALPVRHRGLTRHEFDLDAALQRRPAILLVDEDRVRDANDAFLQMVGYDHDDAEFVHLYFQESFAFRVVTAEAAVALVG